MAPSQSKGAICMAPSCTQSLKSAPSGSHPCTFMLFRIALLMEEGVKCPNDSLGSLKSSFIFLCVDCRSLKFNLENWRKMSLQPVEALSENL